MNSEKKIIYAENESGNEFILIKSELSGGEGQIYYIADKPDMCAKIYYFDFLTTEIEKKLKIMVQHPPVDPTISTLHHHSIAWPVDILYQDNEEREKKLIGFTMPLINVNRFLPLFFYFGNKDRIRLFGGNFTWKHLYNVAFNLSSVVSALHEKKYFIGDFRENNILVSPDALVSIIDCDSFQVKNESNSEVYYCRVGVGEYLPPEIITNNFRDENIDRKYSDLFALSILIFKILMCGFHPFASRGEAVSDISQIHEKIQKGHFPYEKSISDLYPPIASPDYELVIPLEIRKLFHRCFVEGLFNPQKRPSALEWFDILKKGI